MVETSFDRLSLSQGLCQVVSEMGYQTLTPIQALSIPVLMAGRDLIGQSKTGSGKTAAFAIPILEKVDTASRRLQALVLCPTRELAAQVAREIRKLGRYKKDLQVLVLAGGQPIRSQIKPLEHGVQIAVATPGRLQDHLKRKTLDLGSVRVVVLDEADRMLDMGFRDSIEDILKHTPADRQTVLFSATFPVTIEGLSRRYQKSPERVTVESETDEVPDIEAIGYRVRDDRKPEALLNFLRSRSFESVLVFCNLKARVDEIAEGLRQAGLPVDRLHGDLEQFDRERVMAKFRNRTTRVLVATDVAARGIDVTGLDAVVNYDLPADPEQYIHRIGRTGRAGAKGLAISFVTEIETAKLERIQSLTKTPLALQHASVLSAPVEEKPLGAVVTSMDTLSIGGGRKDKLRPGDILGALTGEGGLKGDQVGKIEILDRISYVAIDRASSKAAMNSLKAGRIKGRRFTVQWVK